MNKKKFCLIGIVIILLMGMVIYFRPLSLSNAAHDFTEVQMVLSELGIRNGEPYIDSVNYKTATEEENRKLRGIFDNFTYRRNLKTMFSDGSMSGLGNETLYLYVYKGNILKTTIFIDSMGKILVNEKLYTMKNTRELIEQIIEIVK